MERKLLPSEVKLNELSQTQNILSLEKAQQGVGNNFPHLADEKLVAQRGIVAFLELKELGCSSYFPVAVLKYPRDKQLKVQRVLFHNSMSQSVMEAWT